MNHDTPTDVLIIEDEPIIADDLAWIARELGHRIAGVARSHDEAVALAKQTPPGLILSDVKLADGSLGFEAVKEITECQAAAVVFVTASPEMLPRESSGELALVVQKPYRPRVVKERIGEALCRRCGCWKESGDELQSA